MIAKDIQQQIKAGEKLTTAFFADTGSIEQIAATVCALLNSHGGAVFIGLDDKGRVVGVGDSHEAQRRHIETRLQSEISPKALFTVSTDVHEGRSILTIEIPQGRDKPYVFDGRVFVRRGNTTSAADAETLRALVATQTAQRVRWERRASPDLEFTDLAVDLIARVRDDAERSHRFDFALDNSPEEVLRGLGLSTSRGYTQGCDVLFALRPGERHPQCRVRYVHYETDKTGSHYLDNRWFDGPLIEIFDNIIERVSGQVRQQASFVTGDVRRQDTFNYSLEALREGIVNALAHRDYSNFSGGVSVSVYPDRIEIWNSGQLPESLSVGALKKPHPSLPANPDITHVLYLSSLMERVGRGTLMIVRTCSEMGAPSPVWKSGPSGVTLTIYAADGIPRKSEPVIDRKDQVLLSQYRPGDAISVDDVTAILGIAERTARRTLSKYVEAGYLSRSGRARYTTYQRTSKPV